MRDARFRYERSTKTHGRLVEEFKQPKSFEPERFRFRFMKSKENTGFHKRTSTDIAWAINYTAANLGEEPVARNGSKSG